MPHYIIGTFPGLKPLTNQPMKTIQHHSASGIVRIAAYALSALALSAATASALSSVSLNIAGQDFGNGNVIQATSGAKVISPSKSYIYTLSGTCQGTGSIAGLIPAGTSISTFVGNLVPNGAKKLSGIYSNPSGTLTTDIDVINKTFTGTKTIPGLGSVYISFKMKGTIKSTGEVTLDVTNVSVKTPDSAGGPVAGTINFQSGSKLQVSVGPEIQFQAKTQSVPESGSAVVTVLRNKNTKGTCAVSYATAPGTAGTSDYTPTSGLLKFADGQASKTISIPITPDATHEIFERFTITLSNPTKGAVLGARTTDTIIIQNDD